MYKFFTYFLQVDPNVNAKNIEKNTALLFAAENGNLEIVDLLIKNRADINLKNKNGDTAIKLALKNKQGKVAELLRSNGAKE